MRRRILNNGSDALVDQHTRFLMRFDNDFKVDGYPPPIILRMVYPLREESLLPIL